MKNLPNIFSNFFRKKFISAKISRKIRENSAYFSGKSANSAFLIIIECVFDQTVYFLTKISIWSCLEIFAKLFRIFLFSQKFRKTFAKIREIPFISAENQQIEHFCWFLICFWLNSVFSSDKKYLKFSRNLLQQIFEKFWFSRKFRKSFAKFSQNSTYVSRK